VRDISSNPEKDSEVIMQAFSFFCADEPKKTIYMSIYYCNPVVNFVSIAALAFSIFYV
jgi:hypothetical protein